LILGYEPEPELVEKRKMALGTYQVVLILAGVFALKDLVLNDLGKKVAEDDVDTTLGSTLTSPRRNGPSVKFLYCSS
jgi:hypothetical protein